METGGAPAEAFWNGESLGVRLRAPFAWTLPADAAIPSDYATANALVLPAEPKPNSVGSWGLAGNQPVYWFDLPSGTLVLVK